ncbi:MAG: GTP cyclohydrolase 1 type 2 [Ignavibacteriaceae bacterium]|nr:MAG: GTP cyclohydrolase 1 type 2 [Ignavibacteriota bacterium]GJQ41713.1 MAG: GTP cyclohydrolase 1 type 2 [Ignavibacteriaceae bacterium]
MHFKLRSAFFFEMTGKEIIKYLEDWAPKGIAWQKDNVGLQVGNPEAKIKNILLSLDLKEEVIDTAIKKNCNLIITHHPLLFHPLKNLDFSNNKNAIMIEKLIQNKITLFSAHTNLDFTKHGVSYQLAKRLSLKKIKFLKNISGNQFKLVVFVPDSHVEKVVETIHQSGGGIIGEYSNCSFRTHGKGTFKGLNESNPSIGTKGVTEFVDEVKLEVLVDEWRLNQVITAMKKFHPYEEVAFDVFPLKNDNVNYGIGAVGELATEMGTKGFLKFVSSKLKTSGLRYSLGKRSKIKNVAVCGGSCGELVDEAIKQNADAFITADIKYHTFQDAENKIFLIDAGHYETEVPILDEIKSRLDSLLKADGKTKVLKFKGSTNPVFFYNKSGAN